MVQPHIYQLAQLSMHAPIQKSKLKHAVYDNALQPKSIEDPIYDHRIVPYPYAATIVSLMRLLCKACSKGFSDP